MEEINIGEYFSFVKKHLIFFVSMVLIILTISIFYFVIIKTPMYSSNVDLTLTGVSGEEDKITANDVNLNTKMIPTYQEVITSRKVLEQVIENLKLNKTVTELEDNIKIQAITDSMVLDITVTDSNRVLAKDIANEVASIFSKEIETLYNIKNVTILDKAIVNDDPININYVKSVLISLFAGIFIALFSLFIVFYLDTTVKSVEQVSTKLGMIVLGGVPTHSELVRGKRESKK